MANNPRYYFARLGDSLLSDDDGHVLLFAKAADALAAGCEEWGIGGYVFVEEGIVVA